MKVNDVRRTSSFVKIVDVLRNNSDIEVFFELGENIMPAIRFYFVSTLSSLVIEIKDHCRILRPSFGRCYILDTMSFPQTTGIPKGRYTTLGTYARTR